MLWSAMSKLVLNPQDLAELLDLDQPAAVQLVETGAIPAFQVAGQWRVRREDLDTWMAEQVEVTRRQLRSTSERAAPAATTKRQRNGKGKVMDSVALSDLTERVPQEEMHRRFAEALSDAVVALETYDKKPFELDLKAPLPHRVRVYMYNATRPPGGRPLGEHKIQLIVPGQGRDDRGSFDHSDGRIVLLVGYAAEEDVFVLWDAGLYPDFAWSRNVQVKAETIIDATAGKIATQQRQLRPPSGRSVVETVVAVKRRNLAEGILKRMELTRQRLLQD